MTTTVRPHAGFATADRWQAALAECHDTLVRDRLAASTVDRVVRHVRRFARDVDTPPYDVTAAQVAGWLDALSVSTRAGYAYRTSLRTFYRWAHRAGRVLTDPTAGKDAHPGPTAREIPPGWHHALQAWWHWARATGATLETCRTRRAHLRRLAHGTGAPSPWDLDADDLAAWIARHRWARETTRSACSALRSFYRWAHVHSHIDHDPTEHLRPGPATPPCPRPASEADYRAALAKADPDDALMLRLAAELGLRRFEVAGLHSRDLTTDDTGTDWLTVWGKGGRLRRLPLTRSLSLTLRIRPAGWVFPGPLGHLSAGRVGVRVSALLPPGVTMHALRHRFATQAYNVDRDVFTVQRILGHASPATTQRYVQTTDDTARRLVARVGALSPAGCAVNGPLTAKAAPTDRQTKTGDQPAPSLEGFRYEQPRP